jgi:hypothetical protein
VFDTGERLEPIASGPLGCRVVSTSGGGDSPATPTLLELLPLERGLIAFHSGGHFLCAQPDGSLHFQNSWCSTWECFLASEDWCGVDDAESDNALEAHINRKGIAKFIIDARLRIKIKLYQKRKNIDIWLCAMVTWMIYANVYINTTISFI